MFRSSNVVRRISEGFDSVIKKELSSNRATTNPSLIWVLYARVNRTYPDSILVLANLDWYK